MQSPLSLHTHQCRYSTHTQCVGAALCSCCTYAFVSATCLLFPRLHSFFNRACTHTHPHAHPHTAQTFTHTPTHVHSRAHTFTHTPTRSDRCTHIESPNMISTKHASESFRVEKLRRTSLLSRSFSQKSLIIHGSFLEKDLQLQVSFHKRARYGKRPVQRDLHFRHLTRLRHPVPVLCRQSSVNK